MVFTFSVLCIMTCGLLLVVKKTKYTFLMAAVVLGGFYKLQYYAVSVQWLHENQVKLIVKMQTPL